MITAIHHIAMIVSSERSVDFYRLLGFVEAVRRTRQHDTVVIMEGHGIQLELFVDPSHPPHAYDLEYTGLRHFALKVEGSLEEEIERLTNASKEPICFGPIVTDWAGVRLCFAMDPDGLPVELHE